MSALKTDAGGRPLRVLAVTARYPPFIGGTEIHTYETARRIVAKGHEVTVVTTNPGGKLPSCEQGEGVRVLRVPCWPTNGDYYFAPRIVGVVEDGGWDLVHCQGFHTLVPPLAMLAATKARLPYVVTFHSGGHSSRLRTSMRRAQHELLRPLLARAKRLICVSGSEAALFQERLRLPPERFAVIPNGVQLLDTAPDLSANERTTETLIVSVGRLERYKGHHRVIEALPYVLRHRPDVHLRIIGSGPFEDTLYRYARDFGVSERVEIGALPSSDRTGMAQILQRSSLVTLLSEYESQGISVIEALQLKRPVLVAANSALHEFAQQGMAREISLRSSACEIGDAILQQLNDPLIPPDIPLPTWDDSAEQLIDLYQSTVRGLACVS
jgi:glycosyltransferase involved in cell wall biosynthesis